MLPTTQLYKNQVISCYNSIQSTLKGSHGKDQGGLCTLRKLAEPALTYLDIFRRLFYEPSFLHMPMLRKH